MPDSGPQVLRCQDQWSRRVARRQEFRGLRLLADRLGPDFVGGVLVTLGTRSYTYAERLHVVPLDRLWA